MKTLYRRLQSLVGRENGAEDGATIIEYALLAGLVSISTIVALRVLGPTLLGLYNRVATVVTSV